MLKHPLKMTAAVFGMTALVFGGAAPAYAFTETKVPAPSAQSPAAKTEAPKLELQKPEDGAGLSLTTPGDSTEGTELKIPGVGTVGKLPKLDFGLELLYGNDSAQGATTPIDEKSDDVLIRGKIRHRF